MKILVAGSSGLIGINLINALFKENHSIVRLVRHDPHGPNEISWNPHNFTLNRAQLEGFDAVINLAGENLASGRWTADKKEQISESRIRGTKLLSTSLAALHDPPEVLINASAIGYYGNRGSVSVTEESPPGTSFLSGVCREWEDATDVAAKANIRVVKLRTGVVLSLDGGALKKMYPLFKLGLGGPLGSGNQYMSWISIRDEVSAIIFCLANRAIQGPVNLVSPNAVTNTEFSKILGVVLSRPAFLAAPTIALKLALGEMAEEILLSGAKVEPKALLAAGYQFQDSYLEPALKNILSLS